MPCSSAAQNAIEGDQWTIEGGPCLNGCVPVLERCPQRVSALHPGLVRSPTRGASDDRRWTGAGQPRHGLLASRTRRKMAPTREARASRPGIYEQSGQFDGTGTERGRRIGRPDDAHPHQRACRRCPGSSGCQSCPRRGGWLLPALAAELGTASHSNGWAERDRSGALIGCLAQQASPCLVDWNAVRDAWPGSRAAPRRTTTMAAESGRLLGWSLFRAGRRVAYFERRKILLSW